jgi:phage shock protein PspC (stress-responsive transcriptional regulator)
MRCAACTSWMVERRPVQEWTRARDDRFLGGVARGLATRFGLPVAVLRLAFVLATIFALSGALVYLVLWVILPLEPLYLPPAQPAPPERQPGTT